MRIATFNINNVNKRLVNLLAWLHSAQPDVACLQELKATGQDFPQKAIAEAGYRAVWRGQRSWNGVAILARSEPIVTRVDLPGAPEDVQARYIEAAVNGVLITSLYAPNGYPQPGQKFTYKLAWMDRLNAHAAELFAAGVPVVLAGDFNVVPTDRDIGLGRTTRSQKAARAMRGFWRRAGATRCARFIPTSRCTATGAITAGRAMPVCASIISCSARKQRRGSSPRASIVMCAARTMSAGMDRIARRAAHNPEDAASQPLVRLARKAKAGVIAATHWSVNHPLMGDAGDRGAPVRRFFRLQQGHVARGIIAKRPANSLVDDSLSLLRHPLGRRV